MRYAILTSNRRVNSSATFDLTNAGISTSGNGRSLTFDPIGNRLFLCNKNTNTVVVLNPLDFSVIHTITGLNSPWEIKIDNANNRAFIANFGNNTVTVINLSTYAKITDIAQSNPIGIAINSQGYIFVANYGNNTVVVLNPSNFSVIHTISLTSEIYYLAIDSLDRLYVTSYNQKNIRVYNSLTYDYISTITNSNLLSTQNLCQDQQNTHNRMLVCDYAGGSLYAIDINTLAARLVIDNLKNISGVAQNTLTNKIYILNDFALGTNLCLTTIDKN